MKISRIGAVQNFCISNFKNAKKQGNEVINAYQQAPSFWGKDLVNNSKNSNPLPKEIQEVLPSNTSIQDLITQAQSEEYILGQGANSVVYRIPQLDDYVLKVLNKDDPNGIDMSEFPSDINLGQPVWQDDKIQGF